MLGIQSEGPRRVLLLGLPHRPSKGDCAAVTSNRLIRDAFVDESPYAELLVERPTQRIGLKVLFPRSRPPLGDWVESLPPSLPVKRVSVRCGADGRPFLTWSLRRPERFTTYSLRWSW